MTYNEKYFQKRGTRFPQKKAIFFTHLLTKILKPQKTLDVGCARGELISCFRQKGIEAWGIDISPTAISQTDQSIRSLCQVSPADKIPFGNNSFDLVCSFTVLEHIDEKICPQVISEMKRVSRKNIFLQICVKDNPFEAVNKHYLQDPTHINIQTHRWWRKNLALWETKIIFHLPFSGIFLLQV